MRLSAWACFLWLCWYGLVATASGQAANPERRLIDVLTVTAGATCLKQAAVASQVTAWLGRDQMPSGLTVHVEGDADDARAVVFRVYRGDQARERRFQQLPLACNEAVEVVALGIALALDASALTEASQSIEASRRAPGVTLSTALAVGVEVAFGPSVGALAGVSVHPMDWLGLRADLLGQHSWNNAIADSSGRFDALVLAARPQLCAGGQAAPRARIELCAGVALGAMRASGHAFAFSAQQWGFWAMSSAGLRLHWSARQSWVLDLEALFPVRVPSVRATNAAGEDVFRLPNPAGILISTGPAWDL